MKRMKSFKIENESLNPFFCVAALEEQLLSGAIGSASESQAPKVSGDSRLLCSRIARYLGTLSCV